MSSVETADRVVSMTGSVSSTIISSAAAPVTRSVIGTYAVSSRRTGTPICIGAKFAIDTWTSCTPGGSAMIWNVPSAVVVAETSPAMFGPLTVTVAPGTATP